MSNQPKESKKLKIPKISKRLLIVAALLLLIGTGVWTFVAARQNAGSSDNKATTQDQEEKVPEISEEKKRELKTDLEEIKETLEHIEELSAEDKRNLYTSAAFAAAQLKDPAASGYAKSALELTPAELLNDPDSQGLILALRSIEKGEYEAYIQAIHGS